MNNPEHSGLTPQKAWTAKCSRNLAFVHFWNWFWWKRFKDFTIEILQKKIMTMYMLEKRIPCFPSIRPKDSILSNISANSNKMIFKFECKSEKKLNNRNQNIDDMKLPLVILYWNILSIYQIFWWMFRMKMLMMNINQIHTYHLPALHQYRRPVLRLYKCWAHWLAFPWLFHQRMVVTTWTHPWNLVTNTDGGNSWTALYS